MLYTINIGLDTPAGATISDSTAIAVLRQYFPTLLWTRFDQSATERTLVAEVTSDRRGGEDFAAAYALAVDLGQDCIAVRNAYGIGSLVGPRADKWGEFNPEFFLD